MKILVVDDNRDHLESAKEHLCQQHEVVMLDSYEEGVKLLNPGTDIEVFLSDLLMPAEPYTLGPSGLKFLGHSMPIGLILILRAAQVGVKWIAVVTDTNHHEHPMSAAIDWINPAYWQSQQNLLRVNEARVLIAHAPLLANGRKDWQKVLDELLRQ